MTKPFFIDLEVTVHSKSIETIGFLYSHSVQYKGSSLAPLKAALNEHSPEFICGHNFIAHDALFLEDTSLAQLLKKSKVIDTLFLSMLLFPDKVTHQLEKNYKTPIQIENDPLGDCLATEALLEHLIDQFKKLSADLQAVIFQLLHSKPQFNGFFDYLQLEFESLDDLYKIFEPLVKVDKSEVQNLVASHPIEMAIVLIYLATRKRSAISPAVLHHFPEIVALLKQLMYVSPSDRELCEFAEAEFGIPSFREFEARDKGNDLFREENTVSQKQIVQAALNGESLLAILPTGGGKTFTFQMPALIKAQAYKGLTIVISPLQALMKNHVESFKEKNQNFKIAAISGYLSPIERLNTLEEVQNGIVDVLYLAPEALRSNTIFKTLQRRIIERFVIDEAHCFSSWGHDFRHDYKYIATFIKELQDSSPFQEAIPVSCFTATAKPEVLEDIKRYLNQRLGLTLHDYLASAERTNLKYRAIAVSDEKEKYEMLISELSRIGKKTTIIYIPQNAGLCQKISEQLAEDPRIQEMDLEVEPFYANIDKEIESGERIGRNKSEILNDYIADKIDIVVATTAFGMGIDKPNIQAVIHYETSDSLESYLQESGRGGRSSDIEAECIVLFSQTDFDKLFLQQNRSKIEANEIQRVLKVIKKTKRNPALLSTKQIAESAGIDTEDAGKDYDVMVKTALLELEEHDIIHRGRNSTKIYATSVNPAVSESPMSFIREQLEPYNNTEQAELYENMIRVMAALIGRSKLDSIEVDDLSENVGVSRKEIHQVLFELGKNKLIAMDNDVSVEVKDKVMEELHQHFQVESQLLGYLLQLPDYQTEIDLRDLNQFSLDHTNHIKLYKKTIQSFNHLAVLAKKKFKITFYKEKAYLRETEAMPILGNMIQTRQKIANKIVELLLQKQTDESDEIEFSSVQLQQELESAKLSIEGLHHTLVYLHDTLQHFTLRKGRLIYYQAFSLQKTERIKENTPYQIRRDYNHSLKRYYQQKTEAIHILLKFFNKLLHDGWEECKHFIHNYFSLAYDAFKKLYDFNNKLMQLPVTEDRYRLILANLNEAQSKIFTDNKNQAILVLAGPGSGKTKTLVHKMASLITIEGAKPEYFLMLTHGRAAAHEFRNRLVKLVGNLAYDVDIMTFHAYALQLLGSRVNDNVRLDSVIETATTQIHQGLIEPPSKTMLVLDEYQDVSAKTFDFIQALYQQMNSDKKIIAVGDDDQCINNFTGRDRADVVYLQKFQTSFQTVDEENESIESSNFAQYQLLDNYRSKGNLIKFANEFADRRIPNRLKTKPLVVKSKGQGFIAIHQYAFKASLMDGLCKAVSKDSNEEIAVLCRTNDDVLEIYSRLKELDLNVKYLIGKEGFRLGNIHELQFFLESWKSSDFDQAYDQLLKNFKTSSNLRLAEKVIERFIDQPTGDKNLPVTHQIISFEQYLQDIEFDEFEATKAHIIVSTMHKAKGKEFNSVYIAVENNFIKNEYLARLLYVAITRAKENLYIHTQDHCFDPFTELVNEVTSNRDEQPAYPKKTFSMGLSDLSLSSTHAQSGIAKVQPRAGDTLQVTKNQWGKYELKKQGWTVCVLSGNFAKKLEQYSGFTVNPSAKVEYVVNWIDKNNEQNFLQVLCQMSLNKKVE